MPSAAEFLDAPKTKSATSFLDSPGGSAAPAKQPDYSEWDTATVKVDPMTNQAVPLKNEPGYAYGSVIPMRWKPDAQGNALPGSRELAVPEMLRAPIRGVVEGGQVLTGERPVNDKSIRSDVFAAQTFAAGGAPAATMRSVAPRMGTPMDPLYEFVSRITGGDIAQSKAAQTIVKRMGQDAKAGGPSAQDMLDLLNATPNKPLTLADVGGENTLALAGKVQRAPGESRQLLKKWLDERDKGAGPRLDADIVAALGSEGGQDAFKAMVTARSKAAKPLFDAAYEGGSIAPLERQFETAFDTASKAERDAAQEVTSALSSLTTAKAKQPVTGGNVYAENAVGQVSREAEARVAAAREKLTAAQTEKQQVLEMLRQAQEDGAMGRPGAVWNSRIQQFLNNPRVQQGIKRGLRIERDNALAENRPMTASEYAIVGADSAGEPVVGKVPTMKLLAVAKEGLDRMLQSDEFRNPLTGELNKEGVAVDKMRGEFLKELDAINPKYAEARAQWSGDSKSLEAFKLGEKLFSTNPRDLRTAVAEMSGNDKEFLKLGAARAMHDAVARKGITGDEAKAIIRSQYTRDQIRPLFENDQAYEKFINSVEAEGRMFGTRYSITGNSRTAAREMEDRTPELDAFASAARGAHSALHGNVLGVLSHFGNALSSWGSRSDPATNANIARILSTDLSVPETAGRMSALQDILSQIGMPPPPKVDYASPNALATMRAAAGLGVSSEPQQ